MRIDLIPEVPAEPVEGQRKRVRVSASSRDKRSKAAAGQGSPFQALLQSIYDAAVITDIEGRILDSNLRAVEFLQFSPESLCRMTIFDIISGAGASLLETVRGNLENERFTLIQAYCVRMDKSFFPAEIAVNKLSMQKRTKLCFFIRDITVRKQAEDMLRTEHNAIQNSGGGIAVADLKGRLEYVNPAAARMWGAADPDALLGKGVLELFTKGDEQAARLATVLEKEEYWSAETTALRADGDTFDVQVSAARNRNGDGELVGAVLSFVDISDRKLAEKALHEGEKQRVMLESLGAACHHLSQPATIVLGNMGLLSKRVNEENAEARRLVSDSAAAAEELGDVLRKLIRVNEYRTETYLEGERGASAPESRILEI